MIFWDSSAIVPLIVAEPASPALVDLLQADTDMLVWWGTPVECSSAICRRERDADLTQNQTAQAHQRLRALSESWNEVTPTNAVRAAAIRALRLHPLRAADALQLAAAIVASDHEPPSLQFLTLDDRLRIAAHREGFRIVRP